METRLESELIRIAQNSDSDEVSANAMKQLREINPTYHFCPEWDDLVICDKFVREFECCTCFKNETNGKATEN